MTISKYLLVIIGTLFLFGCSDSNNISLGKNEKPPKKVETPVDNEPIGSPTNEEHTDLNRTEFSKLLYVMKDLCNINNKKSMFGLEDAYIFPESEEDENGYQDGLIVNLLLFEDFTYRLMIWNSKIKMEGFLSYSAITELETRADINGKWVAHGDIYISLDINIKSHKFNISQNGSESRPAVDIQFGNNLPEEIKILEGQNLWAIHTFVEPIKGEDLSCEEIITQE